MRKNLPIVLGILLIAASVFLIALRVLSHETTDHGSALAKEANQELQLKGQDMQLLLQTDPRWRDQAYGSGSSSNDLATNGCAITSLAMILSFYQKKAVTPPEILAWAHDQYYVAGQGTAWSIFPAFATHYQLHYDDLGLDQTRIQTKLAAGQPIVLSVKPGEFTAVGHILVIKQEPHSQKITVFDPNDSQTKKHFEKSYDLPHLLSQTSHAWSFG